MIYDRCLLAWCKGKVDPIQLAGFLIALKAKGETPQEIAGAAEALRAAAQHFDVGALQVVDTCGTGGDGSGTVNISTAVAVVVAEMGVFVTKHGNRSISSRCGSADVLEHCGVRIAAPASVARRCLEQERICFLFAPQYHAGVRHAMPVRRALGTRTLFNLIGPLINPALPQRQLLGIYDGALCETVARTLGLLGLEAALVVHGSGLDEIALHGSTRAAVLREGEVTLLDLSPADFGMPQVPLSALQGGDGEDNATWLQTLLSGGGKEAHQQAVAANSGALLWITDRAESLATGTEAALATLRSGKAADRLKRWAEVSRSPGDTP